MNAFTLALASVRRRPLPAALTVLLLGLGVATVVVLLLFQRELAERLGRDARGIDLVVGAKGSGLQLVLSTVFHIDVPTGNVRLDDLRGIARHPMVAGVIPVSVGDSFRGFRIVGTTSDYVRHYRGRLAEGRGWERPMEAVLGARAARETGLRAGMEFIGSHGLEGGSGFHHDEDPYRVVGILHETGSVLDRLILVDTASVWQVHAVHGAGTPGAAMNVTSPAAPAPAADHAASSAEEDAPDGGAAAAKAASETIHDEAPAERRDEHGGGDSSGARARPGSSGLDDAGADGEEHGLPAGGGEITALLVKYRTPLAAISLPRAINTETALQAASPAQQTARLFALIGAGLDAFRAFAGVLVAASALSLFIALTHALHEQRYDMAVMRTLGASRSFILRFVLFEAGVLGAAGAALGVAAGHAAGLVLAGWLARARSIETGGFGWTPEEGLVAAAAIAISLAASFVPAVRAYRLDVAVILAERR